MRRTIGSARGDERGEAPCMKITLIPPPSPEGKGGGGMGERNKAKGKVGRRQRRQTTLWATANARRPGDLPDKPPIGHLQRRFSPCRLRLGRGDARGFAPCMKITLISPFPGGEERSASAGGGMGAAKQAKGRVSRRPAGQATLWAPPTPAAPATCQANLPPGTTVAGIASAAGVQPPGTCLAGTISAVGGSAQGCRGRSPRRNKLWDSPFPGGEERSASAGRGMGERNKAKGKVGRRQRRQATLWAPPTPAAPATCRTNLPPGTTAAGIAGKQKGAPRGTQVPRGAPRAKKPGNLLNYLLSFLITRLS